MDRLFRIDFYPSEWLVQTGKMTVEQRGIFIQIVAMIYANRGPIENDPAWIGRAAGCSSRLARALIAQLLAAGSLQIKGSKITQKRCERELNMKRTHLESSAKGGRNKAEYERESNNNNTLASSGDAISLSSSTAIATPIATKEGDGLGNLVFFEEFWLAYPKKTQKGFARKAYDRAMARISHIDLMTGLRQHKFPPEMRFAPKPADWLDGDCWLDQAVSNQDGHIEPWKMRIQGWRERKFWLSRWGDTPDSPHCLCPREIIEAA